MLSLVRQNYFKKFSKQLLVVLESAADLNCPQQFKKAIRALSTVNYSTLLAGATNFKDERREFLAVGPVLIRDLTEFANKYESKDAVKLYEKALQYTVTGRKQYTGIFTVLAYKEFADISQLTPENIKLAQYLGWSVDMILNTFFVLDDIMDGSVTRRGQPCLHMLEEVGLTAINDSLLILSGAFHILKEHFAKKDYYVKLLEVVHEVNFITLLGQSMDLQASKDDVTSFTMDRYKSIVVNKSSCFGLYLPIALAMHLCGFTDPEVFRQTKAILYELGNYMQIENDIKDCFGDPEKTGKIGTDIQENKCTWLSVVCMEKASEAQKEIMRECYGKTDPVKIARVKHLYEELELPNIYTAYKEETYNMAKTHSQLNSGALSSRLYKILLPLISRKKRAELIGSSGISA